MNALATYLGAQVPELVQIVQEFPTENIQLKMPSCAVTHDDGAQFQNEMPYQLSATDPVDASHPAIVVVWIVGQWDYKVQLDIWARSVPERDTLFRKVFKALNPNINPMGLSLALADYYGLFARFDVDTFSHVDGEQSSQRGEWRTRISLLASLKEALQENTFAITQTIDAEIEILDTVQDIGT